MNRASKWKIQYGRVLVDKFQLHLVVMAMFHFALVVLVFASALFIPIIFKLNSGDLESPAVQAAAHEFLVLHNKLWMPLLGAFILLVLHNIVVSHRIAGPLYRLRRILKAIGDGDLSTPIRIRKNDYLHKDAEAVCQMVESLRTKVALLDTRFADTNEAWRNLRNSLDGGVSEETARTIVAMNEHLDACGSSLAAFKTTKEAAPPAKTADAVAEASLEPVKVDT
jgi:methyl-accepting chemotaxis protein